MTTASSSVATFDVARVRAEFPALLRRINGLPVANFDGSGGTPTVAFAVDGTHGARVAETLAEQALFVHAATFVERLGHTDDGMVGAGCACTTTDEVDRLVAAVRNLV